jgi:hypothetical protein
MKELSHEGFERARDYLMTEARPLDHALFEHRFEGAAPETVLAELTRYRNEDGGFGRALEPDVRTPTSSALATGIALGVLREVGAGADHPPVQDAVAYLLDTFDAERRVWRVVPEDVNDYPHAPWWHDEGGSLAQTFDDFLIVPRAQLLAHLHAYPTLAPPTWLRDVTGRTVAVVEGMDVETFGGGGDSVRYALDLAEAPGLAPDFRQRLLTRLRPVVDALVVRDPDRWSEYSMQPLKIAPTPHTPVADVLAGDLERNLDYLIETQKPNGAWEPNWTWGDFYPGAWEVAKAEWMGHLTLENLTTLRAYGRLPVDSSP